LYSPGLISFQNSSRKHSTTSTGDIPDCSAEVFIRYFVPDERKSGGAILSVSGMVTKVLINKQQIVMSTGVHIPFDAIVGINLEK
jgi:hypothetical protein